MRRPKVYIETSVFNSFFAEDAPAMRADTAAFFDEVGDGAYIPFTSVYVLIEIQRAPEPRRGKMMELLKRYDVTIMPAGEEVENLADKYVAEGIIPGKYHADAVHIAAASVYDLDFVVSFNFKHIVKRKTITMTEAVNLKEGYKRMGIYSPTEVIDDAE